MNTIQYIFPFQKFLPQLILVSLLRSQSSLSNGARERKSKRSNLGEWRERESLFETGKIDYDVREGGRRRKREREWKCSKGEKGLSLITG